MSNCPHHKTTSAVDRIRTYLDGLPSLTILYGSSDQLSLADIREVLSTIDALRCAIRTVSVDACSQRDRADSLSRAFREVSSRRNDLEIHRLRMFEALGIRQNVTDDNAVRMARIQADSDRRYHAALQSAGHAVGLTPGSSIVDDLVPAIVKLRAEVEQERAVRIAAQTRVADLEMRSARFEADNARLRDKLREAARVAPSTSAKSPFGASSDPCLMRGTGAPVMAHAEPAAEGPGDLPDEPATRRDTQRATCLFLLCKARSDLSKARLRADQALGWSVPGADIGALLAGVDIDIAHSISQLFGSGAPSRLEHLATPDSAA